MAVTKDLEVATDRRKRVQRAADCRSGAERNGTKDGASSNKHCKRLAYGAAQRFLAIALPPSTRRLLRQKQRVRRPPRKVLRTAPPNAARPPTSAERSAGPRAVLHT